MTNEQIKTIHVAAHKAGFSEANYRLVLLNVGGVKSSKDLTQAKFEECMAAIEDMGYCGFNGPTYWRDKVGARGHYANSRMVWLIAELHGQYESLRSHDAAHYELAGLVSRHSQDRTRDANLLYPREAWNLIEALKAMIERIQPAMIAK